MKTLLILFMAIALNANVCVNAVERYQHAVQEAKKLNTLSKKKCRIITESMILMFMSCDYDDKEKVKIAKKVFIMQSQCGI